MKKGDLVRVRYRDPHNANIKSEGGWTVPYHGVVFETPDMGPSCVWKMWCIERGQVHIITPRKDSIEIVNEVNISNRHG